MQAQEVAVKQVEVDRCAEMLAILVGVFKNAFSDLYCFMNLRLVITERAYELAQAENLSPTTPIEMPIFSPGLNSSMGIWIDEFYERMNEVDESGECKGMQMIFHAWMCEAERTFHGFTSFAKNLPGFSDLILDDRIILLKQARVETMNMLR